MNYTQFLNQCQESSQDAYQAFKWLLSQLESSASQKEALLFLHHLFDQLLKEQPSEDLLKKYHFSLSHLSLQQEEGGQTYLKLLQLPSTFAPEEWSYTFFEGLARYKSTEFQDRSIVELGCGIGWITLALAKQAKPAKMIGLDINPKAILCSKINLYLNAYDSNGNMTWNTDIEFHVSDLLEHCRTKKLYVDKVIGCIPQVLNPDPEFTSKIIARRGLESANDEFLYSLSNYTANQGYIEDQFGLGLIARAIEESAEVLKSSGKLILNLGGRPGALVLHQLFLRRGFSVKQIWNTQVSQAKDTDIRSLVAIEEKTPHRFEFYMGQGNTTPVCAKTALAFAEANGEIAHGLTVYEGQLRDPQHLPKILQFLRQPGYEEAKRSIDLAYSEDALAIEKMSYLSALTEYLKKEPFFPYEDTSGIQKFRERLASFFKYYFGISYKKEHFQIAPSRTEVCKNIIKVFRPKKFLIDSQLALPLHLGADGLEIPRNSDLLCELIEKLRPEVVIYSMPPNEAETREPFLKIVEIAKQASSRVFIDISEWIELSSNPKSNAVLRYLIRNPLPLHVGLLCGLVKNRLYRDLEVSFLISENQSLLSHLESAAELTYSRTPILPQLYYDRIIQELINFQILDPKSGTPHQKSFTTDQEKVFKKSFISISPEAKHAFDHPAIAAESFARNPDFIRLDYGENCLPTPKILQKSIFEAFSKMHLSHEEYDCSPEVLELARRRFGVRIEERLSLILGDGVAPLFSEIANYCSKSDKQLLFPRGSYGHFQASAQFHHLNSIEVPSEISQQFKITPESLERILKQTKREAWVVLTAPIVNPTGAIYTPAELESLIQIIERFNAVLVLDSIFSGLEFFPSQVGQYVNLSHFSRLRWVLLGGISKEFAAGGLRVGYGISSDPEVVSFWKKNQIHAPHSTLTFAIKRIYQKLLQSDPELISELSLQRAELHSRAKNLAEVLKSIHWSPLPCLGGLFLTARPPESRLSEKMEVYFREKAGVIINKPEWTGIPNYYRFVLSLPKKDFDEALSRISRLK